MSNGRACQALVPRDGGWRHPSIFLNHLEIEPVRLRTLSPLPSQHFHPCRSSHSLHSSIHSEMTCWPDRALRYTQSVHSSSCIFFRCLTDLGRCARRSVWNALREAQSILRLLHLRLPL